MKSKLSLVDFFCGAGGFSEGFRQMGFEIIYGYDHWNPAVQTFNHNFNLNCELIDILKFKDSIDLIESIPDTDVIIGSPPCVSFSSSNKSGGADKSLGIELTETFFKIIAVKKHKPNSILKAWFIENVVNSSKYIKPFYTFEELDLSDWAIKNDIEPTKIALKLESNISIINSADYGSFQARKRLIGGEIIQKQTFIVPEVSNLQNQKSKHLSIREMKQKLPTPFSKFSENLISDPYYGMKIPQNLLTDHFYDTGIYSVEWKFSKYWKTNHPYMGKMSFPENENKPSRTITATKIANSRESIIYKSEINRVGDGEYRLPTVREAAIIMGFPITYQFYGAENTKWRLVGNAVCCSVSRALAKTVLKELGIIIPNKLNVINDINLNNIINLNTYKLRKFDNPPIKNKGARFRRHTIKDGNLTVTLSNYNIKKNTKSYEGKWFTSIQYGTGKGFPLQIIDDGYYKKIENLISNFENGNDFLNFINNGFNKKIATAEKMQYLFEQQKSENQFLEPSELIDLIKEKIVSYNIKNQNFKQDKLRIFQFKEIVPLTQFFALYALNKITTITNNN